MFCRRAIQRLGPLARKTIAHSPRNAVPARQMSVGIPGGSSNTVYLLLCGGGLTAAAVYAYKTVNSDSAAVPSPKGAEEGTVSDILTTVKILTSSTVEIAAASVGETSIASAVQHLEEKALDVPESLEVLEPVKEDGVVAEEASVVEIEEPKPEEAVLDVESAEEVAEVISEPQEVVMETPAVSVSAAGDEVEENVAPLAEEAPEEADTPAVEVVAVEEATVVEEPTEDASAVEESAEPALEVAEVAEAIPEEEALVIEAAHLAAASVSAALEVLPGAAVEEAEPAPEISAVVHCHSCHNTGPALEEAEALEPDVEAEVVSPVLEEAVQGEEVQEADAQVEEEAVEIAEEAKEEGTPTAGQAIESLAVVSVQS